MKDSHLQYVLDNKKILFEIKDLDLLILKGHLLIEELMTKTIEKLVFHPKYLNKIQLSYTNKIYISRSISWSHVDNSTWHIIEKVNKLRNEVSHSLSSPKIHQLLRELKNLYNSEIPDKNLHWSEDDDIKGIRFTVVFCIGFLLSFYEDISRLKEIIHTIGEIYNPN